MAQHLSNIEILRREGEDIYHQLKQGIQKCEDSWYLKSGKLPQIIKQAKEKIMQLSEHYSNISAESKHVQQSFKQLGHGSDQAKKAEQALRKEKDIIYDLIERLKKAINEGSQVIETIRKRHIIIGGISSILLIPIASSLSAVWGIGSFAQNYAIGLSGLSVGFSLFKSGSLSFGLNFNPLSSSVNIGIELGSKSDESPAESWGGDVSPSEYVQRPSPPF